MNESRFNTEHEEIVSSAMRYSLEKPTPRYKEPRRRWKPITPEMFETFKNNRMIIGVTAAARLVGSTEAAMKNYCIKNEITLPKVPKQPKKKSYV